MTLMQRITAPANLNRAWRCYRNDQAHWQPGLPRMAMESHLLYHLLTLAGDLQSGQYQPASIRRWTLRRANKKPRDIAALTLRDKVAQRAVKEVLETVWEPAMHSDSFGYRPGRNTQMAWARARTYVSEGHPWLVHTDIREFFDRLPLRLLKKRLGSSVDDQGVYELLVRWLDYHATTPGRWYRGGRGVPQGGILSPLLGNWFLTSLDHYLQRHGIKFVRYADDIMLFSKSEKHAKKALKRLQKGLASLGLALNPEKTRLCLSTKSVVFLGHPMPETVKRR